MSVFALILLKISWEAGTAEFNQCGLRTFLNVPINQNESLPSFIFSLIGGRSGK